MHKAIVVELTTERLEVSSVEELGEDVFGEVGCRVQHKESLAPLNDASILLCQQHIMQTSHKLVEAGSSTRRLAMRSRFGKLCKME